MSEVYNRFKQRMDFFRFANIKNKKVLDVGCGKGVSSFIAAEFFNCNVFVIEPFNEKILQTKKYFHEKNFLKKIHFINKSITDNDLPSNDFDFVFCFNVLHHIKKSLRKKALSEMFRVCRSGLFISELNDFGVKIFDELVHPRENHDALKVNLNSMEKMLKNFGVIKRFKSGRINNFYEVLK